MISDKKKNCVKPTSATWIGVEWQLSRRTPAKCLAVISVYLLM